MEKYVTLNSEVVKLALSKAGFTWHTHDVDNNALFLFINSIEPRKLSQNASISHLARRLKEGYIAIDPKYIIKDPFQLDGAKQPEKMIVVDGVEVSESTIKVALKAHVAGF